MSTNKDTMQSQRRKKQKSLSMDIVPSSSISRSTRKGKEIAIQDTSVHSSSGDEDVPQLERKRKPPANPKKKTSRKPTKKAMVASNRKNEEGFQHLMTKTWVPTRWAHLPTLEELGLLEDYKMFCEKLGIGNFLHRGGGGDRELTCEFLSSLVYDEKNASFTFSIGLQGIEVTIEELNNIFGFPQGKEMVIPSMRNLDQEKWKNIGDGKFIAGTKASRIRHPVLRYIHKCLAHTIFARKATGKINTDELYILLKGAELTQTTINPQALPAAFPQLNFGSILITSLLDMRRTFLRSSDKTQQLMIGGIVQPILEHSAKAGHNINIPRKWHPHLLLDIPHLFFSRFLKGKHNNKFAYAMSLEKKFLLPNIEATTLSNKENLTFKPQRGFTDDVEEEEVQEEAPANEEVFGSHRYHFEVYEEPSTARALSDAQDHIETLQKWNKWQDRTIHKLVKAARGFKSQVKSLKEQVKTLTRKLSCEGTSSIQEEEEIPRIASIPAAQRLNAKRRMRQRRQMRSPSPPSSNPSPSLSEEDEPSTPQQE